MILQQRSLLWMKYAVQRQQWEFLFPGREVNSVREPWEAEMLPWIWKLSDAYQASNRVSPAAQFITQNFLYWVSPETLRDSLKVRPHFIWQETFSPFQLDFLVLSEESVYACTQENRFTHYIFLAQRNQNNYPFPLTSCLRIVGLGFVIFWSFRSEQQQVWRVYGDTAAFPIWGGCWEWRVST